MKKKNIWRKKKYKKRGDIKYNKWKINEKMRKWESESV